MKSLFLIVVVSIALMGAACTNKQQTSFEDLGKKADQGTQEAGNRVDEGLNRVERGAQTTGDKIDQGLNEAGEALDRAGDEIHKGFDRAGEEIDEATH